MILGCKGLRLTEIIKETTEKMSLKKFTLNWDLHKWPSDTNWTPESRGSQLASCLVHCCHGNIICDPITTDYHECVCSDKS